MQSNTTTEGMRLTKGFNQHPLTNQFNLEKRVKAVHQERIKSLQKEVVEISLQNNHKKKIRPILAEIKKLRTLLSFSNNKIQSC